MLAVLEGDWVATAADKLRGLRPGFGLTTNIINGGIECGKVTDSIDFHVGRYLDVSTISAGHGDRAGPQPCGVLPAVRGAPRRARHRRARLRPHEELRGQLGRGRALGAGR